jgi:hypothetical protein
MHVIISQVNEGVANGLEHAKEAQVPAVFVEKIGAYHPPMK